MNSQLSTFNHQLTIVTGASSNHFLPLQSLLWTIAKFEPAARVIVYDLGLTADEHAYLEHTPPFYLANFGLRTMDFGLFPPHFSIAVEAGRMAFRPTILTAIANENSLVGRASSRAVPVTPQSTDLPSASELETPNPKPETTLLWLDAGCQLREPLHEIRACIQRDGVYCPCAPGSIEKCLHPLSYSSLSVTSDLLPLAIRDAGICGFDITKPEVLYLLDRWAEVALDASSTAPLGSTRRTHRQDAVFAVLLNQAAKVNHWKLESKRLRGLAIKQDALTLAETKFRTLGAPPSRRQVNSPSNFSTPS